MKKTLLLFLLLTRCAIGVLSQDNTTIQLSNSVVTPVSPEAAAIERYVSYPVDYITGVPGITIPLYEIVSGDLSLPVSLSYHSAGLKPKERSGWIATGWTLNADPSVMRNIRGLPDDATGVKGGVGYFNNNYPSQRATSGKDLQEYFKKLINRMIDEEPDQFYFRLANESGNFFAHEKSYWNNAMLNFACHPDKDIKISALKTLYYIDIINRDGHIYKFGGDNSMLEKTGDYTTRWLCNSICSQKTKAGITFDYSAPTRRYVDPYKLNDYVIIEDEISTPGALPLFTDQNGLLSTLYFVQSNGSLSNKESNVRDYTPSDPFSSDYIDEIKVKNIHFENGRMEFYQDGNGDLDLIYIKDNTNNIIRWVRFFRSRYNSQTELTKLDSIQIAANGAEVHTYKFAYNDVERVPPMLTKGIDHWGFCNAPYNGTGESVVPLATVSSKGSTSGTQIEHSIGGTIRDSRYAWALKGVLIKITNPEGVDTEFTYEGNMTGLYFPAYTGSDMNYRFYSIPVGGLRIKTIIERNKETATAYMRTFDYEYRDEQYPTVRFAGWGVVKHLVTEKDYCFSQTRVTKYDNSTVRSRIRTWNPMLVSNISFNSGSPVMYNLVTETRSDGKDSLKTKYYYHTPALNLKGGQLDSNSKPTKVTYTNVRQSIDKPYEPDEQGDYKYGQLKLMEQYKDDEVVLKTEYKYKERKITESEEKLIRIGKPYQLQVFITTVYAPEPEEIYEDNSWYLQVGWMELEEETSLHSTEYNEKVTTSKKYTYNTTDRAHKNAIKIETAGSTTQSIQDLYTYPGDAVQPYNEDLGGSLSLSGITSALLQHRQVIDKDTSYTRVKYIGLQPELVKTKRGTGNSFENRLRYHRYDAYGNVADISPEGGIRTCYIRGYNNQHIIAKIENATYEEVLAALGNKDIAWITALGNRQQPDSQEWKAINGLRDKLKNAHVYTYTYRPLAGITAMTDANKITTYYVNDNFGRVTESFLMEGNTKRSLQKITYSFAGNKTVQTPGGPDNPDGPDPPLPPKPPVNPYPPIVITFVDEDDPIRIYDNGKPRIFKVKVTGGSVNFFYTWILTDKNFPGALQVESTYVPNAVITPRFPSGDPKLNVLQCIVEDLKTNKQAETSTYFYVNP